MFATVEQLAMALARGRSLKFMSRTAEYKFLRGSPATRPRKIYKLARKRENTTINKLPTVNFTMKRTVNLLF